MLIPPKFSINSRIIKLLTTIEAAKQIVDATVLPLEVSQNIVRASSLKSSLYSARIEGNPLSLNDLSKRSSKDMKKIEVFNILSAIRLIQRETRNLTKEEMLKIHAIVMNGLTGQLGRLRTEISAIFNSAGVAVYVAPPPDKVLHFLDRLFEFINGNTEENIPLRACLAHFIFEKIHPFLDGNGRVGRLILQKILQNNGYSMGGMLTIEEYLDNNRVFYYKALDAKEEDVTPYLEFMLEAIAESAQHIRNIIQEKNEFTPEDALLPRRLEILNIIQDQKLITFDQIHRRFMAVNERTLRYDIKQLIDKGFIKKRGTTKGVYYESKDNELLA